MEIADVQSLEGIDKLGSTGPLQRYGIVSAGHLKRSLGHLAS
jgi:hypothetical protein